MMNISAKQAIEWLAYNQETGELSWRVRRGSAAAGQTIDCLNGDGYVVVRLNKRLHLAHRVIWMMVTGAEPTHDIDHINGNRVDNRLANLREASRQENIHNRKTKGTYFDKRCGKYAAEIMVDWKRRFLGYFDTEVGAREAYVSAKRMLHPSAQERCFA